MQILYMYFGQACQIWQALWNQFFVKIGYWLHNENSTVVKIEVESKFSFLIISSNG